LQPTNRFFGRGFRFMSTVSRSLWICAYFTLIGALVGSLFYLRAQTGEMQKQDEWDAWRGAEVHDVKTHVLRKRPKSQLPPMTALLQDHFGICLAGAVIFGTALFVTFSFLIRGVWKGAPTTIHEDAGEPQSAVAGTDASGDLDGS